MASLNLSDTQVAAFAHAGGFSGAALVTAVAIALAESGGNALAVNTHNANGSRDYGLFQINSVHKPTVRQQTNPLDNAAAAAAIYRAAGNSFKPWATFNSGSYKSHLNAANGAVGDLQKRGPSYENAQVAQAKTGVIKSDKTGLISRIINTGIVVGSALPLVGNFVSVDQIGAAAGGVSDTASGLTAVANAVGSAAASVTGLSSTFSKIASNIGIVLIAALLIGVGVTILVKDTKVAKVASKAVVKGALL